MEAVDRVEALLAILRIGKQNPDSQVSGRGTGILRMSGSHADRGRVQHAALRRAMDGVEFLERVLGDLRWRIHFTQAKLHRSRHSRSVSRSQRRERELRQTEMSRVDGLGHLESLFQVLRFGNQNEKQNLRLWNDSRMPVRIGGGGNRTNKLHWYDDGHHCMFRSR